MCHDLRSVICFLSTKIIKSVYIQVSHKLELGPLTLDLANRVPGAFIAVSSRRSHFKITTLISRRGKLPQIVLSFHKHFLFHYFGELFLTEAHYPIDERG